MKLVIPAVFDRGFLDTVAAHPVSHLYGSVAGDAGLRANRWLPQPKADQIADYVDYARRKGVEFFYWSSGSDGLTISEPRALCSPTRISSRLRADASRA
jgi:hypothetical protein